jgi:hypothetical protein
MLINILWEKWKKYVQQKESTPMYILCDESESEKEKVDEQ